AHLEQSQQDPDYRQDCLPNYVVYPSNAGIPNNACCSGHSAGNHCVPARRAVKKNAVAEPIDPYTEDTVDRATPPLCVAGGNCAQGAPEPKPSPSGNLLPPPTSDVALTPVTASPTASTELLPPKDKRAQAVSPFPRIPIPVPVQTAISSTHHYGPGWSHTIPIIPLPTTFSTLKTGHTPPINTDRE
ncbi:MAG: hypothetical protein Q9181_004137, partial [Wetmoreana brouardii]